MAARLGSVIALAVVLLGGGHVMPSAARAASGGVCPGTTGVSVIVDFGALGGGVAAGCAPGAPSSGLDALVKAGFPYVEVSTVPGFVCRIGGQPGPDKQSCTSTPPGNAYWAYFHASRGGDWVASQMGAGGTKPAQGSVEGWAFQTTNSHTPVPPSVAPPPVAQATPKPTAKPTPASTAAPTARPTSAPTTAPTTAPTIATAAPPMPTPTDSPTVSAPPSPPATDAASPEPTAVSIAPASSGNDNPGDPTGTVIGIGLIVVVGAGALLVARRSAAQR